MRDTSPRIDPWSSPLVEAHGLSLGSGASQLFGGLSLSLPAARLSVIQASPECGKSVLLLALAARGSRLDGRLRIAGIDASRHRGRVRALTSVARIGTAIDLEPNHSIATALRERAATDGIPMRIAWQAFAGLSRSLGLSTAPHQLVGDLGAVDQSLLAVAFAAVRRSLLLVIDDVDRGLDLAGQAAILARLDRFAYATGVAVIASTIDRPTVGRGVPIVQLPLPGGRPRSNW